MKKLIKISIIILIVGILCTAGGVFWVYRDNVNPGSIYSVVEQNLKISDNNFEYIEPQKYDLSKVSGKSNVNTVGYGLNEFNTLEIYAENCSIDFREIDDERMTAAIDDGELTTAITNGTLHVQAICDDGALSIGMPEIFKGACVLNVSGCDVKIGSFDSAMDMSLNLCSSKLTASRLNADNITAVMSGSSLNVDIISAVDDLSISAVSSELKTTKLTAKYNTFTASNCTATLKGISGGFITDAQMSTLTLEFPRISGNITVDLNQGSADILVPKNAGLTVNHDESYGIFQNKIKSAQNSRDDESVHYTMDTNIKFGIVTLAELE